MIEFGLDHNEMACEPELAYTVNKELNLAWEIIENTGSNLFLTGRAGTGKTTFLKRLREHSYKRMVVLAPTGVAAINANGTTLHSFFQLPFSPFIPGKGFLTDDKKFLNISKQKKRLISSLSLIVIDEISMVRPDTLDAIDSVLRRLRKSSRPFGGVQLLLIGDLRQLPPVVKEAEWNLMRDYYSSPYFYESHSLKEAGYQTVELSVVYRQTDRNFIDILNNVRKGTVSSSLLQLLNSRCLPHLSLENDGCIRLTTHNHKAALINNSRLADLPTPEFFFEADVEGNFPESSYPTEKTLRLKEGAQVMFIKNDTGTDRRFYNGLIGKVVSISEEKIQVMPSSGEEVIEVEMMEWENTRYVIDEETKVMTQENIGVFRQYPLQLAWAITIHKSQGLTFDKAIIDASNSFAPGQTYVALSRCRSLEGLFLETPISPYAVITDREVNDFVAYCEANAPDFNKVANLKNQYLFTLLSELFDFESLRRNFADFVRYTTEYILPIHPDLEPRLLTTRDMIETEICGVANKFILSCQSKGPDELLEPESKLAMRIRNGCSYFIEKLSDVRHFLFTVPNDVDNKTYAVRLRNIFDNLIYELGLKKLILTSLSETDFSIEKYLEAKSLAVLDIDNNSSKSLQAKKSVKKENISLKEKKEKKPKGYSKFETLKLFREGKNIPNIAAERGLKENTIAGHLDELIALGKVKLEEVVDAATIQIVADERLSYPDLKEYEIIEKINSSNKLSHIPSYLIMLCLHNAKNI